MAIPTPKKSFLKQLILFSVLVLAVFLIDEPGQFHNSSQIGTPLFIAFYIVISIIALIAARKWISEEPAGKERNVLRITLVLVCIVPAIVATNLMKYADYFLSNKQWKDITAVIIEKGSSRTKKFVQYTYTLQTGDGNIELKSDDSFKKGDTLRMQIMHTMLGSTVGKLKDDQ